VVKISVKKYAENAWTRPTEKKSSVPVLEDIFTETECLEHIFSYAKSKQMKGGHYICGFLDFLEAENFYYTLFEYCSEGELFAKVEIDEIDPKVCQILFHQMVLGLQVIHDAGIVHRDFSLENCFLQPIHSDEERKKTWWYYSNY